MDIKEIIDKFHKLRRDMLTLKTLMCEVCEEIEKTTELIEEYFKERKKSDGLQRDTDSGQ